MSDSEKSLDITIRTRAELAGAQAFEASLERDIGKAKALGNVEELKKLQPQLETVRGSIAGAELAQKDLGDAMDKGAAAAEHSTISHRGLHMLLHEMGNVTVPGLGRAFGALAFGPIGALIAIVSAFEAVKKSIEANEAEMDKLNEILSKPMTGGIDDLKKAWEDASAALAKYNIQMQHVGETKDPVGQEIKNIKELSAAQIEAAKKEVEALGKQEVAGIRARDAAAGKSKEDTDKDVHAAEEKTRRTVESLDASKEGYNLELLQYEKMRRLHDSDPLQKEAIDANEKARQAQVQYQNDEAAKKAAQGLANPNSETGKVLNQQIEAAAAKVEKHSAGLAESRQLKAPPELIAADEKRLADERSELARLTGLRESAKTLAGKLEKSQLTRDEIKDNADTTASETKSKSLTNQERLRQLPGEIDQAQKIEGVHTDERQKIDQINSPNTPLASQAVELGEQLAKIPVQKLDQESKNHLMSIAQAVDSHVTTLQGAATAMQKTASATEKHNAAIVTISQALDAVNHKADDAMRIAQRALDHANMH
jgi:hypothetical protein